MKKKVALTAAAVAMVGTLAVGGTLAWFTDTETATNVVTTGNVDIAWVENGEKITEENPGIEFGKDTPVTPGATLEKTAKVVNEGKNRAVIRAKIVNDNDQVVQPVFWENIDDFWVFDEDTGYYYYRYIVNPDGETTNLITSLTIPEDLNNEDATDLENINVQLIAEAIQADNLVDKDGKLDLNDVKSAFEDKDITSYDIEKENVEEIADDEVVEDGTL
ncbi:MAG TPA: SipW-dependent-type signal peptide-containing protein [Candidatus Lachnoclostridium pullistercoris]|uniref:SipW-dependent-type signal peptide-containing protein n=1 Tax=Candidatus Lachnoclostridium pullistercoris TaxID=2838632 RepID=A0A9D2PBM4_9FIRM|nr:SipW-dependent-type signal peptide-containing protein [Candidatus Lachnoclostridium pullistercoris]